jgi:hypothetical protein
MIRIHSSVDSIKQTLLTESLVCFFNEIDFVCEHNGITDFQEWFTERTFLSMYLNAQVRNHSSFKVSTIQEYTVKDKKSNSHGRCDALLTIDRSLFLLESKCESKSRKINNNHWDIESWTTYDDKIFKQLSWYIDAEELFYIDEKRYDEVFLQTIVFKIIDNQKDIHFKSVESMDISGKMLGDRGWYYGCHFPSAIQNLIDEKLGIEVYGSILRKR